jgi:hypothetical protein
MSTSNETLGTPIPSAPTQSATGAEQNPNQSQEGQEPHYEDLQQRNPELNKEEQNNPSLPGNFPAANAVLALCNSVLEDFRSLRVSKAAVLSRIYTHLLDGILENDISFASTIEEAFGRYLTIIENHQHHLEQAQGHSHRQCSKTPPPDSHTQRQDNNDDQAPLK